MPMQMTPKEPAIRGGLRACAAAALLAAASITPAAATAEDAQAGRLTLWQAIDALAGQAPFSRRNVEAALSLPLREYVAPSNPLFDFFEGAGLHLRDGLRVSNVDLRVKKADPRIGLLVLDLEGSCVRIADVRAHHGPLELSGAPRGHSLEEATSFSSTRPWGELSFNFKERNPDCLAYVVFNATRPAWRRMPQAPGAGADP